jgi:hypothetical protein
MTALPEKMGLVEAFQITIHGIEKGNSEMVDLGY